MQKIGQSPLKGTSKTKYVFSQLLLSLVESTHARCPLNRKDCIGRAEFFAIECMRKGSNVKHVLIKSFERCFSNQLSTNMRNLKLLLEKNHLNLITAETEGVSIWFDTVV